MLMTAVTARDHSGRFAPVNRACPDDFEHTFVEIGRRECEEHYRVGRGVVDQWLNQCGKERLTRERAEHVAKHGRVGSGAVARYGRETVDNWRGLSRGVVGRMLSAAIPVERPRLISDELAREAAHFLREVRNGGWRISPIGDGDWRVELVRKTAAELVGMAKAKGFVPASLTGGDDTKVG